MHIIETHAYRKAFNQYLRKGTSIELSREDAIARVGNSSDFFGVPYGITDHWQTKFNATVRLP